MDCRTWYSGCRGIAGRDFVMDVETGGCPWFVEGGRNELNLHLLLVKVKPCHALPILMALKSWLLYRFELLLSPNGNILLFGAIATRRELFQYLSPFLVYYNCKVNQ